MQSALQHLFRWMPLIFGLAFIAPLIAQVMATRHWAAPLGLDRTTFGLLIGAPWGLYAVVRGRWL